MTGIPQNGPPVNCYNLSVSKTNKSKPDNSQPPQNEEDFFDDCPICQVTKLANRQGRNPTETELLRAFREAKKSGAVVGGQWFETENR